MCTLWMSFRGRRTKRQFSFKLAKLLLKTATEHFLLNIIQDRKSVIVKLLCWKFYIIPQKVTIWFQTFNIPIFHVKVQMVNFFPRLKSILLVHKIAWKLHGCNSTLSFISRESLSLFPHCHLPKSHSAGLNCEETSHTTWSRQRLQGKKRKKKKSNCISLGVRTKVAY